MNISKVWENALELLDSDKKKDREKRDCMKEVLKKLKRHEDSIKEELKDTNNDSKKLRKELNIIQAQQEKAVKIIKGL